MCSLPGANGRRSTMSGVQNGRAHQAARLGRHEYSGLLVAAHSRCQARTETRRSRPGIFLRPEFCVSSCGHCPGRSQRCPARRQTSSPRDLLQTAGLGFVVTPCIADPERRGACWIERGPGSSTQERVILPATGTPTPRTTAELHWIELRGALRAFVSPVSKVPQVKRTGDDDARYEQYLNEDNGPVPPP